MGDFLAAVGLLVAIQGVFLGVWHRDISTAQSVDVPTHLEDAEAAAARRRVREALWKAGGLFIVSVLISSVSAPTSIGIVTDFFRHVGQSERQFDAVRAAIVLITGIGFALTSYFAWALIRLNQKRRELKEPR